MTAILANGDFPREGGQAWRILANAERVVACDGAADAYISHFHHLPTLTVGDLDSLRVPRAKGQGPSHESQDDTSQTVFISEQDTNDLAKAVRVCRERGWEKPVILGATGKRDDHTLGNLARAFEFGLEVVTDFGRFIPVRDHIKLALPIGSPISIFAPDSATNARSCGLVWPLDGVKFQNLYCATLNRTAAETVEIFTDRLLSLYIPFPQS